MLPQGSRVTSAIDPHVVKSNVNRSRAVPEVGSERDMDAATEVIDEGRVGEPDAGHEIDVPALARYARVRLNVEALSRKML